jgi:hypothetical protein
LKNIKNFYVLKLAKEILTIFLFLFLDEPEHGFWTGQEKLYYLTRPPNLGAGLFAKNNAVSPETTLAGRSGKF